MTSHEEFMEKLTWAELRAHLEDAHQVNTSKWDHFDVITRRGRAEGTHRDLHKGGAHVG